MVEFNLWGEAFTFSMIFAIIIIIPCILVALIGRKMIEELGRYPSKTPAIQMSIVGQFIVIEIVTFVLLVGFYNMFAT